MVLVYSCCFWFSLRLGGIIIGIFSIVQALVGIISFSIAYDDPQNIKNQISLLMKNYDLIYVKEYLERIQGDPEKYATYFYIISIIYIFVCIVYIYGAYVCNNVAMMGFILIELIRLITVSIVITMWLLVLKQNTMDIGLVIGASVAGGFLLLGMFYMWVCVVNLPLLINEMERDEHITKINKLQQLLENKNQRLNPKSPYSSLDNDFEDIYRRQTLFVINKR